MFAGAIISAAIFVTLRSHYLSADRRQFEQDASYYSASFKSSVERHVTSLAAIRAFVSTSHEVNRWEFSGFAHQILPENSGFKAVLWLPQITRQQRKIFESNLQRDGLYGLKLRELTSAGRLVEAATRPGYLPVAYVEPFESSGDLIGVDLLGNANYSSLFREAKRTGRQVASGPISHSLIQGAKSPTVLVAFPLNRPNKPQVGPSEGHIEGFVLGVLQLQEVIDHIIEPHARIQAAVAYGPVTAPFIFAGHQTTNAVSSSIIGVRQWFGDSEFQSQVPVQVAGQHFYLVLRSASRGSQLTRFLAPLGAALLIMTLTALLGQSLAITAVRKRQVEKAVVERTAELRAVNATLTKEVEQRREAEAALRNAKDRAETANRAKSAFLATMSHELRTPLNAIIGFSSLLASGGDVFRDKSADYLNEINWSGAKLLDLINDILDITQMDAGADQVVEQVYVSELVEETILKVKPLADKAGVALDCTSEASLPYVLGDSKRLQRALFHLLSNAVKFTDRGGHTLISARMEQGGLAIEVTDDGPGMASVAQIAEFFSQLDASVARKYEGAGIGLTYVRRAANHHGAQVEIISSLGKGTSVAMRFPAERLVMALEVA